MELAQPKTASHPSPAASDGVRHPKRTHDGRPIGYTEPYVKPEQIPGRTFNLVQGSAALEKARKGGRANARGIKAAQQRDATKRGR